MGSIFDVESVGMVRFAADDDDDRSRYKRGFYLLFFLYFFCMTSHSFRSARITSTCKERG